MHWESFYVNPADVKGNSLIFPPAEVRHIVQVLRKMSGDKIRAVDGLGTVYEVELTHVSRSKVEAEIISRRRRIGEPAAQIILAQAVLKGDHFDWIVEKTTELGIAGLIPFHSHYTQLKAGEKKINRWQRIALSAMKQCGRTIMPVVSEAADFKRIISMGADCHQLFIAHAGETSKSIKQIIKTPFNSMPKMLLLVGPEGGFTDEEVEQAIEQGFKPVSLGPRRLRAETAAVTLTVQVMTALDELT